MGTFRIEESTSLFVPSTSNLKSIATNNFLKIHLSCNFYNFLFFFLFFVRGFDQPLRREIVKVGGGQNLKRRNVERPVFRNFAIANIKIKKDELFDNSNFELFIHFLETI